MTLSHDDAYGKNPLPDGMHKGVLAGLSDEEREAAIERRFEEEELDFQEVVLSAFLRETVKKPVRTSLPEALADLTKDDLMEAGLRVRRSLPSSLSKQEMVDAICEAFSAEADPEVSMYGIMSFISNNDFDTFCEAVENGGSTVIPDDDPIVLMYPPCPPYFFAYWSQKKSQVTIAVMPEVMQHYHKLDPDDVKTARAINNAISLCANTCAEYYGMIPFEEFRQMVADYLEIDFMPPDATMMSLIASAASGLHDFALTVFDDEIYICDTTLSLQENGFDDDEEELLDYQTHLVQRHAQMPRCPINQIIDQGPVFDYAIQLNSAKALRKWIDAHVPDGEDDLMFADAVLEDIIDNTKGRLDPYEVPYLLEDYGLLVGDMDVSNELLMLAMAFVNDIPVWENNGYSPEEARLQSGDKRIFRNEEGLPRKIGRNEPCPCGSGKKYKQCCGR